MAVPWTFADVTTQFNTFVASDLVSGAMTAMVAIGLGALVFFVVRRAFVK